MLGRGSQTAQTEGKKNCSGRPTAGGHYELLQMKQASQASDVEISSLAHGRD